MIKILNKTRWWLKNILVAAVNVKVYINSLRKVMPFPKLWQNFFANLESACKK